MIVSQSDVFSSIAIANVADANSSRRLAQQRPIFVAIQSARVYIRKRKKSRSCLRVAHVCMYVLRGMDKVDVASRCRPYRESPRKENSLHRAR